MADDKSALVPSHGFWFWALPALGATLFIWLFQSVLTPFAIGLAIAYLLNPLVSRLGRKGIGRGLAALALLLIFLLALLVGLLWAVPLLLREADGLLRLTPALWERLQDFAGSYAGIVQENLAEGQASPDFSALLKDNAGPAAGLGKSLAQGLAAGGSLLFSLAMIAVIAPVTAFFMIKEWPAMTNWLSGLIPLASRPVVLELLGRMDKKIAGFVRGQLIVAATLGAGYALTLFLMGLPYGLLIGLMAGVLNLVPLLGSTCGLLMGVAVAWASSGDWQFTGLIALVFVAGQLIEGNLLTPRIVGENVGMHPLWVFFAVMAGASVAGLVGMLLAVPVAACIGVLLDFAVTRYKESPRYRGPAAKPAAKKPKKRAL